MHTFASFDGREIAYLDTGEGPAALLLHGFAADHQINWVTPGVVDALVDSGRRVIAPDARGHGMSAKPHDSASYAGRAMVRDAKALIDHLGLDRVDIVGYSMGSLIASRLVTDEPRARSVILGGVGAGLGETERMRNRDAVVQALEADDRGSVTDPTARAFRAFADRTGADRLALAAHLRASPSEPPIELGAITIPTLVVAGDRDTMAGPPSRLADKIPGAIAKVVTGDHLSAVNDPAFARSIVQFIESVPRE
jgi:pimeloyl-ACP methyl ester carboxylesterase